MNVHDIPILPPIASPLVATVARREPTGLGLRSTPIGGDRHSSRLAIVYVRQSEP